MRMIESIESESSSQDKDQGLDHDHDQDLYQDQDSHRDQGQNQDDAEKPPSQAARRRLEHEKLKMNEMKTRIRHKANLVAKGYEQQYGVDFWAMFFSIPHTTMICMLIAFAAYFG